MTKVLLHIGTGKTGSSSIQEALDRAQKYNLLVDVIYPRTGSTNHNHLAAVYKSSNGLPRVLADRKRRDPRGFARRIEELQRELFETVSRGDTVISTEYLNTFHASEAESLCRDLVEAGAHEIQALLYVREPASFYLSYIQQQLKASHRFVPVHKFVYQIDHALSAWSKAGAHLVVRPFVRQRLIEQDIVSDFLTQAESFFGHQIASTHLERQSTNESISAEGMILAQRYRQRHYPQHANVPKADSSLLFNRLQASWNSVTKQTSPRLRPEIARGIARRHATALAKLAHEYSVDLRSDHPSTEPDIPLSLLRTQDVADLLHSYDPNILDILYRHCTGDLTLS